MLFCTNSDFCYEITKWLIMKSIEKCEINVEVDFLFDRTPEQTPMDQGYMRIISGVLKL